MSFCFKPYIIHCLTNLHAGSGDANYGVIDKLVQRDPVTGHPTIHASSLKGALREHFENKPGTGVNVDAVFGKEGRGDKDSETGNYKFLAADLLALPVRCTYKQYVPGFDTELANAVNQKIKLICNTDKTLLGIANGFAENTIYHTGAPPAVEITAEDIPLTPSRWVNPFSAAPAAHLLENRYAVFSNTHFAGLSQNLPVIARNNVEDGTSKNLWYEEIVPHQTLFITCIGASKADTNFEKELLSDLVQIGGNATVGYGLCKFYEITL